MPRSRRPRARNSEKTPSNSAPRLRNLLGAPANGPFPDAEVEACERQGRGFFDVILTLLAQKATGPQPSKPTP